MAINNHRPDDDGLCVDSMLPPAQCAGCMGHTQGEGLPRKTFGSMAAHYSSRVSCGHRVSVGDMIYQDASDGDWICGSCSTEG